MQERWKVFTIVYRPTPLIPHFVRHYALLGFTDIIIVAGEECSGVDWNEIRAQVPQVEIHIEKLYRGVFDNGRDTGLINGLRTSYVESLEEWASWADLDEFFEFPIPLHSAATLPPGINCLEGFFVDRIAANGMLPDVLPNLRISLQFPISTRITKRLLNGNDRKVMLFRGFQLVNRGHHSMEGERVFSKPGRILHYKWNSMVLSHLDDRISSKEKTGYQWTHESSRFLNYWRANGRIRFSDVK